MKQTHSTLSAQNEQTLDINNAMSEINTEFKERETKKKAKNLHIKYINLSKLPINDDFLRLISEEESVAGKIITFFQIGKKLRIATPTPFKKRTKEIIQNLKNQNYSVDINLCSKESLLIAQKKYNKIKKRDRSVEEINAEILENAKNISDELQNLSHLSEKFKTINADLALAIINRTAIRFNASDIHIESLTKKTQIRARIDGTLRILFSIDQETAKNITRQIKFNANIASNLVGFPSDGQFSFPLNNRKINVRVSVLPSNKGESIVLRYLDPKKQNVELEQLGFSKDNKDKIDKVLQYNEGLIITTGPTGSGKTTTLYAILKNINTPEKKIITLENPIEYEIEGITQSSINTEKGYDFSDGLKSALRQDPDVILLGEIRDRKTAETALQASMTGHLVLSTLHTNSAVDTIIRLKNLEIPSYLISNSLKGIIAQRLMRKPCPHCTEIKKFSPQESILIQNILSEYTENKDILDKIKQTYLSGKGCDKCGQTGYKGRSVVSEVIILDKTIRNLISENKSRKNFVEYLQSTKHKFIAYDAALKIVKGESDIQEAIRVLGAEFSPQKHITQYA
ncbi:TPA: type II/IV secretion system protein [Candidatus Gracilibacteria bacterium]|nr:type II/IV secretion system protein [Candidatus Gracilibacteria bacterium]